MGSAFLRSRWVKWVPAVAVTVVTALSLTPASASSANISHPYKTTDSITNGSLVVLNRAKSNYVQLANTGNATRLLGVAVANGDSLLAVDSNSDAVQVATNGNASALVSTVNGAVHVGDQISTSPFNGVGMKAAPGTEILGLAQTSLDDTTQGTVTQTVLDKSGKNRQVKVGLVRVNIAVSAGNDNSNASLTAPQSFVKTLTGHNVSTARAFLSLVVAAVALLALVTLIYASIYSSIISVGRNPLAKYAIFRTLGSVLGMVVVTALVASVTLFLLLR